MKQLCVLLGAGASYDMVGPTSVSKSRISGGWKPPLTSELFAQRAEFENVLTSYRQAFPLVLRLRNLVAGSPDSLDCNIWKLLCNRFHRQMVKHSSTHRDTSEYRDKWMDLTRPRQPGHLLKLDSGPFEVHFSGREPGLGILGIWPPAPSTDRPRRCDAVAGCTSHSDSLSIVPRLR